ncbi:MAG TPA: SusD/RagB family nutrient-binding outer membrane lipoprotein [Chitinophagaceae bacterium]|nr:SusD/RagB family nutrient-binding outer membrane lipoprotein [Chitinophagaceae bacterium]
MKLRNIAIAALLGASALAGCKKSWLDVNTNPNSLPSSTPNYVFTNALSRMSTGSGNLLSNETGEYYSGHWTQSNSYILSATTFSYQYTNTDFNYWDGWYDLLEDFEYADQQGKLVDEYKYISGPAKVMKALLFQQVVDAYGSAPYSEALKGGAALSPKFDDQKDIYKGLIKDLDTAITYLKANPFPGSGAAADIAFNGNTTRWIQFANSLKMRILIRQSRVAGMDAYIVAEINKAAAVTEGFLTANNLGVNPGFLASTGKTNPYYDRWGYNASGATQSLGRYPRPTKFLIDFYKSSGDSARMKRAFYAIGGENGTTPGTSVRAEINSNYAGVPFGVGSGYSATTVSPIGPSMITKGQYNKAYVVFTAAETNFLLAEAKQRYGAQVNLTKTAQEYYEEGVKQSFSLVGASAAAATALLTNGQDLTDWTASTDKLKAIWMQKWIALTNYNGFESWAEYRRTGFPVIPQSASVPTGSTDRPVRFLYPQTEVGSNQKNVPAQPQGDKFSSRIFWDVD